MDADSLSLPAVEPARRPAPLAVLGAAVAGHLALVAAPAAVHGASGGLFFVVASSLAPAALVYGLWRRDPWSLLAGVPLGWALPAYGLPAEAFDGTAGWVAVGVAAAYLATALAWLRRARRAAAPEADGTWQALEQGPSRTVDRDPTPWVGGLLVALPALGVALWPPLARSLDVGFPGRTGPAGALLALIGTLIGLAMATDLARGRRARPGSVERAVLLGVILALLLGLWMVLSG